MKHFHPDGSGLSEDDPATTHKPQGLAECFNKDENGVNLMLGPSQ